MEEQFIIFRNGRPFAVSNQEEMARKFYRSASNDTPADHWKLIARPTVGDERVLIDSATPDHRTKFQSDEYLKSFAA